MGGPIFPTPRVQANTLGEKRWLLPFEYQPPHHKRALYNQRLRAVLLLERWLHVMVCTVYTSWKLTYSVFQLIIFRT